MKKQTHIRHKKEGIICKRLSFEAVEKKCEHGRHGKRTDKDNPLPIVYAVKKQLQMR
jgi:hypothetical protein